MRVENLESRRLFSSAVIGDLHRAELHIVGDANSPNTIVVTYASPQIQVVINGGAVQNFQDDDVRDIRVEGGNLNDTITFAGVWAKLIGKTRVIRVYGLGGDDTLTGSDVASFPDVAHAPTFVLSGGEGDDVLTSGHGVVQAVLTGGNGNDTLTGTGECTIYGDNGHDHIFASKPGDPNGVGTEIIYGGNGSDLIEGENGLANYIFCGRGNDTVIGGAFADVVFGGDGDDSISGGDGFDKLFGQDGNDTISGENDGDAIYGNLGDDSLTGGPGVDTVYGGGGNDTLTPDGSDVIVSPEFGKLERLIRKLLDGIEAA